MNKSTLYIWALASIFPIYVEFYNFFNAHVKAENP